LQPWREIRERQIAAQNEIEKAWDSVGAQIVMHERDAATMPFEDAEQVITFFETPRPNRAAVREATPPGNSLYEPVRAGHRLYLSQR
jgi:hypothetical protein